MCFFKHARAKRLRKKAQKHLELSASNRGESKKHLAIAQKLLDKADKLDKPDLFNT